MKKVLSLILTLVICLSLCACDNSNSAATITDLSGNTVQLTAKELGNLYEENAVKYNQLYNGASITAIGTVKEIDCELVDSDYMAHIVMKEGWELIVCEKDHNEVANLRKGDKIQFTSKIRRFTGIYVELSDKIYYGGNDLRDFSEIVIVK